MKYTLIVKDAPYQSQAADTACRFAHALIAEGHELAQVFFYFEGVFNAVANAEPPQDDRHVINNWTKLALENELELVVCSTAAQRRGVAKPLATGFRLDTLGRLVEAVSLSDRVITFGS